MPEALSVRPDFDWTTVEPDYTPEYVAHLRKLTGEQKLQTASALYRTALKVKIAGLKRRNPDWDEAKLKKEAARALMLSSAMA